MDQESSSQPAGELQVAAGVRVQAGVLFAEGGLHRPTLRKKLWLSLSPSPRSERYSQERVSPSNTKDKSILASVICPMASFIIRITYRGKSTSFEVRQLGPDLRSTHQWSDLGQITPPGRTQLPRLCWGAMTIILL